MNMLSIIIPVYNVERYLRECLDSILSSFSQAISSKEDDIEVILVDDGSPDASGAICDEYAARDSRFKVIHQKNRGVSAARNAGLEIAKGDWISFVDSDDILLPGYGQQLRAYSLELRGKSDSNPSISSKLSTISLIYFPHEGYELEDFYSTDRREIELELLRLKYNDQGFEFFGYTWNKFFRGDIIREHRIRFPEGLKHREDEYFTTEYCRFAFGKAEVSGSRFQMVSDSSCFQVSGLLVVSEPLYHYRIDDTAGHLTGRVIGPEELMEIARNIARQVEVWQTPEMRSYELFRAMRMMYDAIRKTQSPVKQLRYASELRAYSFELIEVSSGLFGDRNLRLPEGLLKYAKYPILLVMWLNLKKLKDRICR